MIIFFVCCKKSGNGYVQGNIYETGTNIPIEGAIIILNRSWHGSDPERVDITKTDGSGHYKIDYRKTFGRGYSYHLKVNNEVDHNEEYIINKKTVSDFSLLPPAFIKVRAKKTSNSTNYIVFKVNSVCTNSPKTNFSYDTLTTNTQNIFDPFLFVLSLRTYDFFTVVGNTTNTISWQVYNNNLPIGTASTTSLYLNRRDTLTYTIPFN